jgi:hypothetical protein
MNNPYLTWQSRSNSRFSSFAAGEWDGAPAQSLTFTQAFASSSAILRNWFEINTGPTVPLTTVVTGTQTITTQGQADALVGKLVRGRVVISASDLELQDFGVEWDGSGTGVLLVEATDGVDNVHLHHFLIDGKYGNISYGLGGTTFSETWLVENGEIRGCGGDGVRTFKNSTYKQLYVHSFRDWNEANDGVYDPNGSQSLFPHTDAIQTIRSGNTVTECWLENTRATNATSGCIVKSDTDEQITSFTMTKCYVDGGGVPFYIDNANADIDNPGTHGQPIGLVFTDILVGRNHREARVWRHSEVPSSSFTKTNILYADTRTAVPEVFVDGFNRANENLEANAFWNRISGAAGALTVDTNRVRSTATAQSTFLIDDGIISNTNHAVETDWRSSTTTGWMLARYVDENNYVGMQILAAAPVLYTRIGGTFTVRVTSATSLTAGDKVRIECFGQEIRLWHKGVLRGTYTMDPGVLTSGRVGIQARTTIANPMTDNFLAETIEA